MKHTHMALDNIKLAKSKYNKEEHLKSVAKTLRKRINKALKRLSSLQRNIINKDYTITDVDIDEIMRILDGKENCDEKQER